MSAPNPIETASAENRRVDCVEIYLPKTIEFLAEVYRFLREKVTDRFGQIVLDGFSVYEVDGVFHGMKLWEQRTIVIRLMFVRPQSHDASVEAKINDLGREIANTVAIDEEQIWICHYPQNLKVFAGLRKRFQLEEQLP